MMHEQQMQRDGGRGNNNDVTKPSTGSGNRNTDSQDSGSRGFYNEWDGGGAGGAHAGSQGGAAQSRSSEQSERGSHAGRGPKGYRRSDERLTEAVHDALSDDHELDASNIEIKVTDGEVTLTGTVSSRQDKRRAETLLDDIRGLNDVHNQIKVERGS